MDLGTSSIICSWKDITSAPKDGTWILLWRRPTTFGNWDSIVLGRWSDGASAWCWPDTDYFPFTDYGLVEANYLVEIGNCYEDRKNFTHWSEANAPMPAPAPMEA